MKMMNKKNSIVAFMPFHDFPYKSYANISITAPCCLYFFIAFSRNLLQSYFTFSFLIRARRFTCWLRFYDVKVSRTWATSGKKTSGMLSTSRLWVSLPMVSSRQVSRFPGLQYWAGVSSTWCITHVWGLLTLKIGGLCLPSTDGTRVLSLFRP